MAQAPAHPPSMDDTAFDCPHCQAYARQSWGGECFVQIIDGAPTIGGDLTVVAGKQVDGLWFTFCERCGGMTVWYERRMFYPDVGVGPPPNPDLSDEIKADYQEAQSIANRSPRGAAALLRLCVQKLCKELGEPGKNIDSDIKNLVSKGLPVRVQQALDYVRVIGNNAVHPGQIDLKDDPDTVAQLFRLANLVAEVMISAPKHVDDLYQTLPQSARDAHRQAGPAEALGEPEVEAEEGFRRTRINRLAPLFGLR